MGFDALMRLLYSITRAQFRNLVLIGIENILNMDRQL